MALNDRRHLEAYSIIRRLVEQPTDTEGQAAALQWMKENKPSIRIYSDVARSLGGELRE